MFTGLIQSLGTVAAVDQTDRGATLSVSTALAAEIQPGDSVAVNGVCLTATEVADASFSAEAMNETLSRTSLGGLTPGANVNLELPLRATDRLGGHVVQGHVDGLGTIAGAREDGFSRWVEIEAPLELLRYVVEKGSVAVDGVSLTVAELGSDSFAVALIPETHERTNLGRAQPGQRVNLEVDVLAKYVERLMRTAA
jgi:riboflavin synthase